MLLAIVFLLHYRVRASLDVLLFLVLENVIFLELLVMAAAAADGAA